MATVASKIAGNDLEARQEIAPFEVVQFNCEGSWLAAAWRLRHLFRHWDADVVFVTTDREHLVASVACWFGRRGSIVRRAPDTHEPVIVSYTVDELKYADGSARL